HDLLAKSVDLHRPTSGPMEKCLFDLGWTGLRQAATHRLTFLTYHFAATDRATIRHVEPPAIRRLFNHIDDLRNHIAATFEQDAIVDLYAQTFNLVFIVQGRVTDRGAPE